MWHSWKFKSFWMQFEISTAVAVSNFQSSDSLKNLMDVGVLTLQEHWQLTVSKTQWMWECWHCKNTGSIYFSRALAVLKFQEQWLSWNFKGTGSFENSSFEGCGSFDISSAVGILKFQVQGKFWNFKGTKSIELAKAFWP